MTIKAIPLQAITRIEIASDAERGRLRKRIDQLNKDLKALVGKDDKSSSTKRAKIQEDLKVSRAQKKRLSTKAFVETAAEPRQPDYYKEEKDVVRAIAKELVFLRPRFLKRDDYKSICNNYVLGVKTQMLTSVGSALKQREFRVVRISQARKTPDGLKIVNVSASKMIGNRQIDVYYQTFEGILTVSIFNPRLRGVP